MKNLILFSVLILISSPVFAVSVTTDSSLQSHIPMIGWWTLAFILLLLFLTLVGLLFGLVSPKAALRYTNTVMAFAPAIANFIQVPTYRMIILKRLRKLSRLDSSMK